MYHINTGAFCKTRQLISANLFMYFSKCFYLKYFQIVILGGTTVGGGGRVLSCSTMWRLDPDFLCLLLIVKVTSVKESIKEGEGIRGFEQN